MAEFDKRDLCMWSVLHMWRCGRGRLHERGVRCMGVVFAAWLWLALTRLPDGIRGLGRGGTGKKKKKS